MTAEETVTATAKDFAKAAGLTTTKGYVETTGLIRFLTLVGLAKEVGIAPAKTKGKSGGKGPKLWQIPKHLTPVALKERAEKLIKEEAEVKKKAG